MTTRAQMSKSAEHESGHTNLMRAALEGRTEDVKTLLGGAADVNGKDDEGRTALMFAVTNIQMMLREGRMIFSGTNEEFVQSEDTYIQKFISGTEMEPV